MHEKMADPPRCRVRTLRIETPTTTPLRMYLRHWIRGWHVTQRRCTLCARYNGRGASTQGTNIAFERSRVAVSLCASNKGSSRSAILLLVPAGASLVPEDAVCDNKQLHPLGVYEYRIHIAFSYVCYLSNMLNMARQRKSCTRCRIHAHVTFPLC